MFEHGPITNFRPPIPTDMTDTGLRGNPKHAENPIVRIVAHNTSPKQPDTVSTQRVKLLARQGSIDVDSVEDLLSDAVADGELEQTDHGYRVPE